MSAITPGAAAPPIELKTHAREAWRLADHQGRHNVVLAFFPFAFSKT
jgi:peroxiredoxin (alkyl hydroperoxide reductase subunit C)